MKPFLTSLGLSSVAALAFGWWQHGELQRLRAERTVAVKNAERLRSATPPPDAGALHGNAGAPGNERIQSRSMVRVLMELLQRVERLTPEELEEQFQKLSAAPVLPAYIGLELAAEFSFAAAALGRRDPAGTLDKLDPMHGEHHQAAAMVVWMDWVLRDRNAAVRWLQKPGLPNRDSFFQAVQMYISPTDPGIAAALTENSADTEAVTRAAESALVTLAASDPETALAKLDTVTDEAIREQVRSTAFAALRAPNPKRALEIARTEIVDGISERSHAVMFLANTDGKAALQWLASQDVATQQQVIGEKGLLNAVIGGAVEADFQAVAATLDPDLAKALIAQHDVGFAFSDPRAALVRAENEADVERRTNYLRGAAEALARKSEESVIHEWLKSRPQYSEAADVAGAVARARALRKHEQNR